MVSLLCYRKRKVLRFSQRRRLQSRLVSTTQKTLGATFGNRIVRQKPQDRATNVDKKSLESGAADCSETLYIGFKNRARNIGESVSVDELGEDAGLLIPDRLAGWGHWELEQGPGLCSLRFIAARISIPTLGDPLFQFSAGILLGLRLIC